MTVAEGIGTATESILDMVGPERKELNMSYHFDQTYLGLLPRRIVDPKGWSLLEFKNIYTKWEAASGIITVGPPDDFDPFARHQHLQYF